MDLSTLSIVVIYWIYRKYAKIVICMVICVWNDQHMDMRFWSCTALITAVVTITSSSEAPLCFIDLAQDKA